MDVSQLKITWAAVSAGPSTASPSTTAARDAQLDPKLVSAAHQFEASMMSELLKPLSSDETFGGDEEDGGKEAGGGGLGNLTSSADGSGGALMSFGSEALAKALSEKGGLGIARRVLDHFEAAAGTDWEHSKGTATGDKTAGRSTNSEIRSGIGMHY
jgi:flagellar protein FlgJ